MKIGKAVDYIHLNIDVSNKLPPLLPYSLENCSKKQNIYLAGIYILPLTIDNIKVSHPTSYIPLTYKYINKMYLGINKDLKNNTYVYGMFHLKNNVVCHISYTLISKMHAVIYS